MESWSGQNTKILQFSFTEKRCDAICEKDSGWWMEQCNQCCYRYTWPSWRMIVQLSNPTEAYGVYPGGQDGNPGVNFTTVSLTPGQMENIFYCG